MSPRTLLVVAALFLLALPAGPALAGSSGGSSTESQTLSVGSTGKAVKQLQRRLGVRTTGYYGSETRAAVKRFQRRRGLKADGIAGPATLRALGIRVRSSSYATGGSSPSSGSESGSEDSSSGSTRRVRLPAVLRRIAKCESGGNPRAVSPDGRYRGKFQFDLPTWRAWGGKGDPARAPESVQDRIALKLYRARGTAPWPNCA